MVVFLSREEILGWPKSSFGFSIRWYMENPNERFSQPCACVRAKMLWSYLTLCTLWTAAHQAPLSLGFPRQEYWSELPCPPPGDLPNPGIKPRSLAFQEDSLQPEPPGSTRKLEWAACPFPSGSFQPRNRTGVSGFAGRFFTS